MIGTAMFNITVDQNIKIVFLHQKFSNDFSELFKSNKLQLTKWYNWSDDPIQDDYFSILIEQSLLKYAHGTAVQCGISYKDEIVGYVGLCHINQKLAKAEMNFLISQEFQGLGIMTKTCHKMINYAFDFLLLDKLEISIATENINCRRVCESLNFELEGILKHSDNLEGKIVDHARYGLINPNSLNI